MCHHVHCRVGCERWQPNQCYSGNSYAHTESGEEKTTRTHTRSETTKAEIKMHVAQAEGPMVADGKKCGLICLFSHCAHKTLEKPMEN